MPELSMLERNMLERNVPERNMLEQSAKELNMQERSMQERNIQERSIREQSTKERNGLFQRLRRNQVIYLQNHLRNLLHGLHQIPCFSFLRLHWSILNPELGK